MRGLKSPISSLVSQKLDLSGCVLYLPLWRPDMVARGGSIVNGTGTMNVSPQALAVGANTITVSGAGNFIIATPVGGTCASGTATITGSPVTLNAGISTTVTAEGVGNFTVTTSNIIKSKDNSNTSCTVTEAVWTSKGYDFDGIDDAIIAASVFGIGSAANATMFCWFYLADNAKKGGLVHIGTPVTGFGMGVGSNNMDTNGNDLLGLFDDIRWVDSNTAIGTGWHCAAMVISAAGVPSFHLDATDLGAFAGNTANAPVGSTSVGCNVIERYLDAIIGDVLVFNRVISFRDYLQWYQRTKWRYN